MQNAITFAETGHLCLSTLHANNANQALDRILHFFPDEMHRSVIDGFIAEPEGNRCSAID